EDGIRDATVTGVQTCALPIYLPAATFSGQWASCRRKIALATSTSAPAQWRPKRWRHAAGTRSKYSAANRPAATRASSAGNESRQIGRASCREGGYGRGGEGWR